MKRHDMSEMLTNLKPLPAWILLWLFIGDSMLDISIAWFQNAPTDLENVPPRDWVILAGLTLKAGFAAALASFVKLFPERNQPPPE